MCSWFVFLFWWWLSYIACYGRSLGVSTAILIVGILGASHSLEKTIGQGRGDFNRFSNQNMQKNAHGFQKLEEAVESWYFDSSVKAVKNLRQTNFWDMSVDSPVDSRSNLGVSVCIRPKFWFCFKLNSYFGFDLNSGYLISYKYEMFYWFLKSSWTLYLPLYWEFKRSLCEILINSIFFFSS